MCELFCSRHSSEPVLLGAYCKRLSWRFPKALRALEVVGVAMASGARSPSSRALSPQLLLRQTSPESLLSPGIPIKSATRTYIVGVTRTKV